jgi:hypothetical protein
VNIVTGEAINMAGPSGERLNGRHWSAFVAVADQLIDDGWQPWDYWHANGDGEIPVPSPGTPEEAPWRP